MSFHEVRPQAIRPSYVLSVPYPSLHELVYRSSIRTGAGVNRRRHPLLGGLRPGHVHTRSKVHIERGTLRDQRTTDHECCDPHVSCAHASKGIQREEQAYRASTSGDPSTVGADGTEETPRDIEFHHPLTTSACVICGCPSNYPQIEDGSPNGSLCSVLSGDGHPQISQMGLPTGSYPKNLEGHDRG